MFKQLLFFIDYALGLKNLIVDIMRLSAKHIVNLKLNYELVPEKFHFDNFGASESQEKMKRHIWK